MKENYEKPFVKSTKPVLIHPILTIFLSLFLIDIKPRSLLLLAFRSYLRHIGAFSVTISVAFQEISLLPVEREIYSVKKKLILNEP